MGRLPLVAALAVAAGLAGPSTAAAQEGGAWNCAASAVRGTVLGTTIEPVFANVGEPECRTDTHALVDTAKQLPLPLQLSAVTAGTSITGASSSRARDRTALAVGGVTDLKVLALSQLPDVALGPLLDALPSLSLPIPGALQLLGLPPQLSLDLVPAVRSLLDGLNTADVLTVQGVQAAATAACVDGQPKLVGASQVAGVRVLGQDLGLDGVLDQTLDLLDTTSLDLSDLDVSKIKLPLVDGITGPVLQGLVQPLLKPLLDALPPISIPAAVLKLKVTPNQQTRSPDGRSLTQRALRVEASLLGQPLLDVVVGEAAVGNGDVDCSGDAGPQTANDLALACTTRKLVLTDVVPEGRRVRLLGAADRSLAGKRVAITLQATGKVVARPVVRADGSFTATAPMPSRKVRSGNRARYVAKVGRERSLNLKLQRRMQVTGVRSKGGAVTISGRVARPLAGTERARRITVKRRLSCKTWETVGTTAPKADGSFRITVDAPEGTAAAVYRLGSKVRRTTRNPKLFPTFSLPRAVNLL
ncbi:hypothetical protein [Conexibacter sp. SYSU D00693]|uniref:hypothetical protein n=1 Tax=Conexibacter sp. SYSU D00693 TaxID=2812560 RepID=UPI00196AF06B|nr:hypothetical protein [Conexibacter sp. SYSU D00693]